MNQVIISNKEEAEELRFITLATSKEKGKEVLSSVHRVSPGMLEGCDGFRLHRVRGVRGLDDSLSIPESGMLAVNGGKTTTKSTGKVYDTEEVVGTYPDSERVMPKGYTARVFLNRKLLLDALQMDTKFVEVYLDGESDAVLVAGHNPNTGTDYKAVIMPVSHTEGGWALENEK